MSAAPTTGGRLERRKQRTRQRILAAAQELFATHGFDATTYDEIANRADVGRQTVFNHFPHKEDFLRAWAAQRRQHLQDLLAETAFRQTRATEQLTAYLRELAEFNEHDRHLGGVVATTFSAGLDFMLEGAAPDVFAQSIRLGQQRGEFDQDLNPELIAEVIYDCYLCTLGRWLHQNAAFPLSEVLLAKLTVILDGISVVLQPEN